jgi:hypothetical protein
MSIVFKAFKNFSIEMNQFLITTKIYNCIEAITLNITQNFFISIEHKIK